MVNRFSNPLLFKPLENFQFSIFNFQLLIGLWAAPYLVSGQSTTYGDVVRSALSDPRLAQNAQLVAQARSLKFQVPLIRRAEARIGFNGSTVGDSIYGSVRNEDFYGVVVGPNSLRERRRQGALKDAQVRAYEQERGVLLAQAVRERLETVATLHYAQKNLQVREQLGALLQQKMALLRTALDQGASVKIGDVLDAESDWNTFEAQLRDIEQQKRFAEARLANFFSDQTAGLALANESVLSTATLGQRVAVLKNTPIAMPIVVWREAQAGMRAADKALEDAQNRQIFNFVQLGYDDPVLPLTRPRNRRTYNNFSFRVALEVPIAGNNNPQRANAALDLLEAQQAIATAANLQTGALALQFVRVENLLMAHRALVETQEKSLVRRLLEDPKTQAQMSPSEWLDAHLIQQKLQLRQVEVEQQLLLEYVRLLDLKGVTALEPVRNYLSEAEGTVGGR